MTHTDNEQKLRRSLSGTIAALAIAGSLLAAGCSSSSKAAGPVSSGSTSSGSALSTSHSPKKKKAKKTDTGSLDSDTGSSIDTGGFDSDTGGFDDDTGALTSGGGGELGPIHFTPPEGYAVDTTAGGSGTSYANADGEEITVPSCDDSASSTASDAAATCAQTLGQLSNVHGPVTGTAGGRQEALLAGTAQPSGAAAVPLNFAVMCYQASSGFECATLLTSPDVDISTVLSPFVDAVEQSFGG